MLGGLLVLALLAQSPPRPPHAAFSSPVPLNIAQGGAQAHAPSDTLEAFDLPLDVGADDDGRHVVTEGFVQAADRTGVDVRVWTGDEQDALSRMVDVGLHGITTDHPDRFTTILEGLPEPRVTDAHAGQLEMIRTLQDRMGWLTPVMHIATFLGDADFYLLVFPLLYWSVSRRLGLRLGVMLLLSAGVNGVLKLGSGSPRPFFLDPDVGLVDETTFGIPSGHAQNAVAVWGTLAAELRRRWTWVAAVGLMLLLGWSRIHLGAHFPVDTVTGWAVGVVLLGAYLRRREPVAAWLTRLGPAATLGVAFASSLVLIGVGAVVRTSYAGWSTPAAWIGAGESGLEGGATGLSTVVTPAAALFGLAAGAVVLHGRGGFDTAGPVRARILRYPVGLAGMVVLWQGLGAVFPDGETVVALAARYLRYALVGAWATGGAPLVFRSLGLAAPRAAPHEPATTPVGQPSAGTG